MEDSALTSSSEVQDVQVQSVRQDVPCLDCQRLAPLGRPATNELQTKEHLLLSFALFALGYQGACAFCSCNYLQRRKYREHVKIKIILYL